MSCTPDLTHHGLFPFQSAALTLLGERNQECEKLRAELQHQQEMTAIAAQQAEDLVHSFFSERGDVNKMEREGLRRAVRDLSQRSDEQAIIGKLHHALIHSRINEREKERALRSSRAYGMRMQSDVLRLERALDRKNEGFYLNFEHSFPN